MNILKIIILQLFWLLIVFYGKNYHVVLQFFAAFFLVGLDYFVNRPKVSIGRYLFLLLFFTFFGFLNDSSLIWMNFITKESYQFGNLSLWIVFIIYYEQIFAKFQKFPLFGVSIIGGIGGTLTYLSAHRLGAISIAPNQEINFIISQFVFWSIFFPISLKIYFSNVYWDSFLDKTIFFSFDQTGFIRHKLNFNENLEEKKLSMKNVLVTGATGGIGSEVAASLSKVNSKVFFTGRNINKGLLFEAQNKNSKFISLDMANWNEVYNFAKNCEVFDSIVFNAGSMPEKIITNPSGVEFQCASQLLGHYFLMIWLKEFRKINPGARIVWVSSGGMYLKKLDLPNLFKNGNYDKVETYANVKRAQVTLVEELAKLNEWSDYFIYSMHPGWVKTDGLKDALPAFYNFMEKRLRTPSEGADTILWCLLSSNPPQSGGLYFDRKKVSAYVSRKYFPTTLERADLIKNIEMIKSEIVLV